MRNLLSMLTLAALTITGCSTNPRGYPKGNPPGWTDEKLFSYVASSFTEPSALSGYTPLNGDDLAAMMRGVDFLLDSPDRSCPSLTTEDHYFFFKRTGPTLAIRIEPAFVPDPENVSGVYPNEDGTQRVIVAPIDGARRLKGCYATIETNDNGLNFTRTAR